MVIIGYQHNWNFAFLPMVQEAAYRCNQYWYKFMSSDKIPQLYRWASDSQSYLKCSRIPGGTSKIIIPTKRHLNGKLDFTMNKATNSSGSNRTAIFDIGLFDWARIVTESRPAYIAYIWVLFGKWKIPIRLLRWKPSPN